MAENTSKGEEKTYEEAEINLKLPNRCRRCHVYAEDPDAPSLRESFVILLRRMTQSPGDVCFLLSILLPYLGLVGVSLTLLGRAGYTTMAGALFHSAVFLILAWLCVIQYFGRRYSKVYSTEQDLLQLEAAEGVI